MQITLTVNAPEITAAIHALANAIGVNTQGTLSAKNALATTIAVLADNIEASGKMNASEVVTVKTEVPDTGVPETTNTVAEDKPISVTEEIPTVVELRAMAQLKGGTADGKKAIKALLNEFESKSISDVPEDKRAAFLQKLEALKTA